MPTKKPMTTIVFDEDTFKRIDDFRFNNRIESRSQAVMRIIEAGMKALASDYPELDVTVNLETGKKQGNDGVNEREIYHGAQGEKGEYLTN